MRRIYTFKQHFKESLKNPKFKQLWEESKYKNKLSKLNSTKSLD